MSQNAKQNQKLDHRTAPTIPFKPHDPEDEVSPDDPIGVQPPTGQGGQPSTGPMK